MSQQGETLMAFKPNYNQQRNDRKRAKEQKAQKKQQRREELAAAKLKEDGSPADAPEAASDETLPSPPPA